jgi:hypothetical protein
MLELVGPRLDDAYSRLALDAVSSLHHLLIKGLTYLSFGTKPGEKPLE